MRACCACVFLDADIERAATAVVASSHRNSGQTCICANRVFVHVSAGGRQVRVRLGKEMAHPRVVGIHTASCCCCNWAGRWHAQLAAVPWMQEAIHDKFLDVLTQKGKPASPFQFLVLWSRLLWRPCQHSDIPKFLQCGACGWAAAWRMAPPRAR